MLCLTGFWTLTTLSLPVSPLTMTQTRVTTVAVPRSPDHQAPRRSNFPVCRCDIRTSGNQHAPDDQAGSPDALTAVHGNVLSRVERSDDVVGKFRDRLSGGRNTTVRNWERSESYAVGPQQLQPHAPIAAALPHVHRGGTPPSRRPGDWWALRAVHRLGRRHCLRSADVHPDMTGKEMRDVGAQAERIGVRHTSRGD
jgi:hypothetical protein